MPSSPQDVVEVFDLVDELDGLAVPFDRRDIVRLDLVEQ